ncbi:hypothetical protein L596_011458 [Steinernema carpocapsae]|uniref:Uncharacterized protein n=1 Tax=Steinernema carpocapsae TaxID=34508 RepID=A0A4U5NTY2_STECR|nr:hypothetical protein L596_011458 [Steinernema carpocapsae]
MTSGDGRQPAARFLVLIRHIACISASSSPFVCERRHIMPNANGGAEPKKKWKKKERREVERTGLRCTLDQQKFSLTSYENSVS